MFSDIMKTATKTELQEILRRKESGEVGYMVMHDWEILEEIRKEKLAEAEAVEEKEEAARAEREAEERKNTECVAEERKDEKVEEPIGVRVARWLFDRTISFRAKFWCDSSMTDFDPVDLERREAAAYFREGIKILFYGEAVSPKKRLFGILGSEPGRPAGWIQAGTLWFNNVARGVREEEKWKLEFEFLVSSKKSPKESQKEIVDSINEIMNKIFQEFRVPISIYDANYKLIDTIPITR